jgi:DNA-directed RNA polymerase subunit omega
MRGGSIDPPGFTIRLDRSRTEASTEQLSRLRHLSMNYTLLEDANKVIENKQVLINVVSRRVRQLSSGVRPHVEVEPRMTFADVALAEILAGKLTFQDPVELDAI